MLYYVDLTWLNHIWTLFRYRHLPRIANYVTVTEVAGTRGLLIQTRSSAVAEAAQCFVSVNSTKRQAQSSIISYTLALDFPLRKLNYVLFSSAYSLVRGFLHVS